MSRPLTARLGTDFTKQKHDDALYVTVEVAREANDVYVAEPVWPING